MAGEMLGLKLNYLDAGSGAQNPVHPELIDQVKRHSSNALLVGGGINTIEKAEAALNAGADIIVVGNATEKDPNFIIQLGELAKKFKTENAI